MSRYPHLRWSPSPLRFLTSLAITQRQSYLRPNNFILILSYGHYPHPILEGDEDSLLARQHRFSEKSCQPSRCPHQLRDEVTLQKVRIGVAVDKFVSQT